ncbi:tRNA (adenine(22)-N(1))-methyltransferase [Aquisalibacillus elongatus]|uniref:tRNA (Adenine22-N1)-methyltransferase n=1 Tax=Aquisalibacillus elongatus TaxID=485577 RepID=A0A3N5C0L4_9BACI|nr:tRNA (adenine(22)-N(1))-methyltransferase TrmK [Aquisalibacillus elongatus]RPF55608.1 tRNA (adenine22-N1)-methyltransferase [Aquisalibacillus elongatus]
MNPILLSKRLKLVADYIPDNIQSFADIGSDHAYLPCYVCLNNSSIQAIAGEVNRGPWLSAKQQVDQYHLSERIDVRLGNGLEVIKQHEVDCIAIAGMGGTLITDILTNDVSKLKGVQRLILQPNIDAQSIREFAEDFSFQICHENILDDDGYIYEILVLEPVDTNVSYTDKEKYLGPLIINDKNDAFYTKWKQVLQKKQRIIDQMAQAKQVDQNKIQLFKQQVQWIKEEIDNDNDSKGYRDLS